jgi:hypothetical protein
MNWFDPLVNQHEHCLRVTHKFISKKKIDLTVIGIANYLWLPE